MATVMTHARPTPLKSAAPPGLPTMIAMPQRAMRPAISVESRVDSRSQIQAMPAATKGPVAMMIATFDTFVSCSAGMNVTMPNVERHATSQPLCPVSTRSRTPARPCVSTRNAVMKPPPNKPRQNRMVQESRSSSRVKNGAVLQAIAAATTSAMPNCRCRRVSNMQRGVSERRGDMLIPTSHRSVELATQ